MRAIREVQSAMNLTGQISPLPENFLNCYEVTNASALKWPVSLYIVERADGQPQKHEDRGQIKNIIFELRMKHRERCKGYGFIVEIDEQTVAVPDSWEIPDTINYKGYNVTLSHTFMAKGDNPAHKSIVMGIIREGVKKHFKDTPVSDELGILWQNYNSFCQMPGDATEGGFHMCRKFDTTVKVLRDNRLVLECMISTATLDGRTIADYYRRGEVETLAEMIEAKRQNRLTRGNKPPDIRVWQNKSTEYTVAAAVRDLVDPDGIINHAKLTPKEQRELRIETVSCSDFPRQPVDIPTSELRLVLDAQITGEEHSDTIIDPDDREKWLHRMRNFINGAEMYGQPLLLSEMPFDADSVPSLVVMPPAVRVRGENGTGVTVEAPEVFSAASLEARAKERMRYLRRYGFLHQRDIRPVLAFPERYGKRAASRMAKDLNYILQSQGIEYRFVYYLYKNADDLRKEVERRGYDAVLAVLPESSRRGYRPDDTHEKIKKRIEIPSQCVHIDNTLPPEWQNKPAREFRSAKPRLAARIRQTYELCLANLLVKHGWVPYAPVNPFHFNVHVGWDVGGRHNTQAMVCMGYGFHKPQDGLLFRPDEIPIDVRQAEPIPTKYLFDGLLAIFERMHAELSEAGIEPDFDYSLFIRDGALLGDGDRWNEKDALRQLHTELLSRKWVSEKSVWPAVEILKDAEGLRLMRNDRGITNPLVGRCVFPFDDENKALVCTTGEPYLSQGTASPIIVRIVDIYGQSSRSAVIRDIVWGADMAFTKPDTGMKLPWALHVADTGALQMSRSYKISGITV